MQIEHLNLTPEQLQQLEAAIAEKKKAAATSKCKKICIGIYNTVGIAMSIPILASFGILITVAVGGVITYYVIRGLAKLTFEILKSACKISGQILYLIPIVKKFTDNIKEAEAREELLFTHSH